MVRNVPISVVDAVPRAATALSNDYADGHIIAPHRHRQGQLIFGASGTLVLSTPDGTWVMPPQRGIWIPPETRHDVRMLGNVSVKSIFLEPDSAVGMPEHCQVVG